MTLAQTLHHFTLACGVLPESDTDQPMVAEETPGGFTDRPLVDGVAAPLGDLIAENDTPPIPTIGAHESNTPSQGGSSTFVPTLGPGGVPSGGIPGTPGTPSSPGTPTPPGPPPVNVVPEPASFVFALTGFLGLAGEIRRRFTA